MATPLTQWISRLFNKAEENHPQAETPAPGPLGSSHPFLPSYRQVHDSEEKYKIIFEEAREAMVVMDFEGKVIDWNHMAEEMFGWQAEEAFGQTFHELVVPKKWHAEYLQVISEYLQKGTGVMTGGRIERIGLRKNGKEFPVEVAMVPLKGQGGAFFGFFIRDCTERNKTQKELQDKTLALEESNRALEQFAFMASHDLQEPLRKIIAFGDLLSETLKIEKDTEEGLYLKRIQKASLRMKKLIVGLLTLSRATTFVPKLEPLNLSEVLKETLEEVFSSGDQSSVRLDLKGFPVIQGDRVQIGQLFQNLISNGLKFHREDVAPEVRIYGGVQENGFAEVIVQDNGIGFENEDEERVFQPFQKLHGVGKYEGSGMGLAICRKIVEKHSGKITAQSKQGQGTTFSIKLPIWQEAEVE